MFKIRKFDLVVALYIFGVMTAEIFGPKTFPLTNFSWMHLNASVAIFVLPLLFTLTDVVVEVHGKQRARSLVWSGLIVITLLLLFSLLATNLPPSHRFASTESAYDKIFSATARISAASLTAFAVSELLDIAVFAKLREKMHKKALWLRNNVSNFISQFADSTVFIFLAFYALHESLGANLSFLFSLIIPYWLIRCTLSVVETPLVYLGVWWLKGDKKNRMIIKTVKTDKIVAGGPTIFELLDKYLAALKEGSVVAITSKIVAICEGNVVPIGSIDKEELIKTQSKHYLPASLSKYGISFSITKNTLIPMAGIDESNGNGNYILWPKEPQKSANEIREYLVKRFRLKKVGVIITDSSVMPLRYGTVGIVVSHSGFLAANDYRGKPDLFDRPFKVSISSVAGGLAAAAALQMGEGIEQTPIAIIENLPFVQFQSHNPSQKELADFYIPISGDDLFAPFLQNAPWQKGKESNFEE